MLPPNILLLGSPLQSSLLAHCSCSWGPVWRQCTELWCGSENIVWADDKFFTKMRNIYAGNTLRGAFKMGGLRQVPRTPSLKHTTVCNPVSCTRLRILLNTICRKLGVNSLRTPLNHVAEQASNETLKQTQQRNWSNASQGGQTALKEHVALRDRKHNATAAGRTQGHN